ncbi:efflux RND transporter periplasmic adaptor subunit [Desulforhopalus sp. 52FAK]
MSPEKTQSSETKSSKPHVVKGVIQLFLSIIILGGAVALASHYVNNSPKAKPRARSPKPPLVTVTSLQAQDISYEFDAMGTVTSAQEIGLIPRVNGEIISISPEMVPGGQITQGEELFSIDPTDYEITILQLKSDLAKAVSDLNLEMGNQRIAIKEFEILGQKVSDTEKDLMLRKPQLGIAKAAVAAVEAQLKRARIDLQRTRFTAPFNGVILSKNIDLGSRVSSNSPVGQLVGTDQFWVKVSLPVQQLRWLTIPAKAGEPGSVARIYLQEKSGKNLYRQGNVIRLAADLETEGRMAVIYVAVNDPLSLMPSNKAKPQLFLGSFVQVTFAGQELKQVFTIDRNYFHENNTVWLLAKDNTLEIRTVDVLARTKTHIYTSTSLGTQARLITSQISSPSQGTQLQVLEQIKSPKHKGAQQ